MLDLTLTKVFQARLRFVPKNQQTENLGRRMWNNRQYAESSERSTEDSIPFKQELLAMSLTSAIKTGALCAALMTTSCAVASDFSSLPAPGTLASGASWSGATHLIEFSQGTTLSATGKNLGQGSFELADGTLMSFQKWYRPQWTDVSVSFMTLVTENVGIVYGLGSGEYAPKYQIEPSFRLGLAGQWRASKNAFFSFKATATLGGRLKERSCTADYGDIGGVQAVNCRLAASLLSPEETLQYLVRENPSRIKVHVEYRHLF